MLDLRLFCSSMGIAVTDYGGKLCWQAALTDSIGKLHARFAYRIQGLGLCSAKQCTLPGMSLCLNPALRCVRVLAGLSC
jgi:hypothetical protein